MRRHASAFAPAPVLSAVAAVAITLGATANRYGYHRDELYFRMLPPAWGHLDQPPLTPLIARWMASVVDEPWLLRVPAIVAVCLTVLVVAALARELGGGRLAQGLAAWGTAFGVFTLSFGHVLLTASIDLLLWPLVVLLAVRALRRDEPRWWLLAGLVAGVGLYNKLLIVALLAAIAIGLLVAGPRRALRSPWLWCGVLIAVVVGLPNLIYQLLNGLPQLQMGAALGENNGAEVRVTMWPFLALLLGPPLVPTWVAGLIALVRRPAWRDVRFLAPAFAVLLLFGFVAGAQVYYPYGMLVCLYAVGCVPVADWARTRGRRVLAGGAIAVNAAVAIVLALPVIPVTVLGQTPIPGLNQLIADQVSWPTYAAQVQQAVAASGADAVITSNYGEAGALDRYGSGGAPVVSGHNALADLARPADDVEIVVMVGGQYHRIEPYFDECKVVAQLDNGLGVDNEEQGEPIAVCHGPVLPWSQLWSVLEHLD